MTCIVGIEHNGAVYMAGDRSLCLGPDQHGLCRQPKVRKVGGLVMGCAGDSQACDLALTWTPPPYPSRVQPYPWLVHIVIPALWDAMGSKPDVQVMLGLAGELYQLDSSGGCWSDPRGYGAIGVDAAACAALAIMSCGGWSTPKRRLTAALKAAAEVCPWCREPFDFVRV